LKELKCNNCGGTDITIKGNGLFVCGYCGVTFTQDQIDKMETRKHSSIAEEDSLHLEKQIKNGETWLRLGENRKAREVFEKTVNDYPMDYRGWYGLAKSHICDGREPEGNALRNFILTAPDEILSFIEGRLIEKQREEERKRNEEKRKKEEEIRRKIEEEAKKRERQKKIDDIKRQEAQRLVEEDNKIRKRNLVMVFVVISVLILIVFAYTHNQHPELFEWLFPKEKGVTVNKNLSTNTVKPEMVRVRKGSFQMGTSHYNTEGDSDEKPAHTVTFTYDYSIGKYEVTMREFDAFCLATGKTKPSDNGWGRNTRPVINVTWWDAIQYCNWLSEQEGYKKAYDSRGNLLDRYGRGTTDIRQVEGYRLPTEAEWEYAARGGSYFTGNNFSGSNVVDMVAWYRNNAGNTTHPAGEKRENELEIHDMSGNVNEWCHDWRDSGYYSEGAQTNPIGPQSGTTRVVRGGSWNDNSKSCRSAFRNGFDPVSGNSVLGFRCARTL